MTTIYTVAYNKSDEFLAFKVDIPKDKLGVLNNIMNWDDEEFESFIYEGGRYDLSIEQVKVIENMLDKQSNNDLYGFQIDSGKIYS